MFGVHLQYKKSLVLTFAHCSIGLFAFSYWLCPRALLNEELWPFVLLHIIYIFIFCNCLMLNWLIHTFNFYTLGMLHVWASLVALMVKNLPAMPETQVRSLGREDLPEKGMATHSRILAWRSPRTEEPLIFSCMVAPAFWVVCHV